MRIYVDNFVKGRRGYSSVVYMEDGPEMRFGTVFYNTVADIPITTAYHARDWCEENIELLWEKMGYPEDDGVFPGLSTDPMVEATMVRRARKRAGWDTED